MTRSVCLHCKEIVVLERDDDPWFHDDNSEERCWPDRDEFATPTPCEFENWGKRCGLFVGHLGDHVPAEPFASLP